MPELKVFDLVEACVQGDYQIPEFQREFVWRPSQVAAFADSLSQGFPVGALTVWPQTVKQKQVVVYVVDGQQRLTALCILFGKRPCWRDQREWDKIVDTTKPSLNVSPEGEWSFGGKKAGGISLQVSEILAKESLDDVVELVRDTLDNTKITSEAARSTLYEKAKRVWGLRENRLPVVEVTSQDPMEVAQMYQRLNLAGTKIREPDILLAYIAVKNEGWVKGVFRAFIEDFRRRTNNRWVFKAEDLLRCMTILDSATPRVRELRDERGFWESGCKDAFEKVKDAARDVVSRLERYGVYAIDDIPSNYALIALLSFHARFSADKDYDFAAVFRWFLAANVVGRYTGAPLQHLSEDAQKFMSTPGFREALNAIRGEIPDGDLRRALDEELGESFKRGSPAALLLKVLLWEKGLDWRRGGKLSQYPPLEWHHIFPPKILKNMYAEEVAGVTANRTLLSEDANKEFKDKPPWLYGPSHVADPTRFESHFVPTSYAKAFVQGKAINTKEELAKCLTQRLNLIEREARHLLGV